MMAKKKAYIAYKSDMAKVRPSNLFLRPLDLFRYLEKQTMQVH